MRLVEVFTTLIRARLPAQITSAAALPVAGPRAVLGRQERNDRTAAERVAEELEANLMRVAVDPRQAWRGVAVLNGALGRPRHACARQLHDLSNPLSREPTARADAR
jgi:hypothetical protein